MYMYVYIHFNTEHSHIRIKYIIVENLKAQIHKGALNLTKDLNLVHRLEFTSM